jgi:hypothetical protein
VSLPTPLGLAALATAAAFGLQSQSPSRPAAPASTPNTSAGLAWADVDVDGFDDLLAADAAGGLKLLRNAGNGQMVDVTESYGLAGLSGVVGASWTDADADGLVDLLLVTADGRAQLWKHHGAFFADVSASAGLDRFEGVLAAAWVDYDRDGLADLVLEGALERALLHHLGDFAFEAVELPDAAEARTSTVASTPRDDEFVPGGIDRAGDLERRAADDSGRVAAAAGPGGSTTVGVGGVDPAPKRGRAGGVMPAASCALSMTDLSGGPCIPADSQPQLGALYPLSVDFNLASNGDVGMGRTSPLAPLHVTRDATGMQVAVLNNDDLVLESHDAVLGLYSTGGTGWGSAMSLAEVAPQGGSLVDKWSLVRRTFASGASLHFTYGPDKSYATNTSRLELSNLGNLGLGTTAGADRLRVSHAEDNGVAARIQSTSGTTGAATVLAYNNGTGPALSATTNQGDYAIVTNGKGGLHAQGGSGTGVYAEASEGTPLHAAKTAGTGSAAIVSSGGDLWTLFVSNTKANDPKAAYFNGDIEMGYSGGFGLPVVRARVGLDSTNAGFAEFLNAAGTKTIVIDADVNGDGRITTDELVIKGGADLVERFDVREDEVEPGTVLVIDDERPGELRVSTRAYDRAVAGVVSGAGGIRPGVSMGQEGVASGDTNVALTGRVYVRASAENGPIRPGDRMTTSSTPGHAMRVDSGAECDGAVIGKAMGGLDAGTGLVLLLVNLQ